MSMPDRDDELVRAALRALRRADQDAAPGFGPTLRRSRPRSVPRVHLGALAVGATLVGAAILGWCAAASRARLVVPREVIALSSWKPPSDVLLETPARSLLRDAPRLGASILTTRTLEIPR